MLPFNRGEISQAFANFLGLKGQVNLEAATSITPTMQVGNILDSPYYQYGIPVGGGFSSPAVAARFAHLVLQPGSTVALQVKKIRINNPTGAAWDMSVRMLTAANVAALANLSAATQLRDLGSIANPWPTLRSSFVRAGDGAAVLGTALFPIFAAAGADVEFTFPDPVVLYGNDSGGRPALAVVNNVANVLVQAHFFGKEWPLPG